MIGGLRWAIGEDRLPEVEIFACGPDPMLEAVATLARVTRGVLLASDSVVAVLPIFRMVIFAHLPIAHR